MKDSLVADCAMAVLKALENCISKEKFKEKMKQFGWTEAHYFSEPGWEEGERQQSVKNISSGYQQGGTRE